MSITITDPALLNQLASISGSIDVCGPDGRVLGTFAARSFGQPPPGYTFPIADDELERRRQETTGRSLDEILKDLEHKHGG